MRTVIRRIGLVISCAIAAALASAAGAPLAGQGVTTSAVSGQVTDSDGTPVRDAVVELRQAETGAVALGATGPDGRFFLANLRPGGPYTLVVSHIGYAEVTRSDIQLRLGQTLRVDVTLSTDPVVLPELAVRLESDPVFDPSRMGAETVIEAPTLERLPTISRDFLEFAQLSPLVKVDEEGVSVAGSNLRFNNIQIDGALNQDVFGLSPNGVAGGQARGRVIPLGAIQELQVLVAPFDVRESGFTGGVVNAVTRTGTNRWEGAAFGFIRDESFVGDVVIEDVSRKPDQLDNIYAGFTLGGPVARDRLHFFAAGELERRRRPPDGFQVGLDDPLLTGLAPDSVARFQQLLAGYGADAGEAGSLTLENDLANLFGRLDLQIDDRHSAMVRYSFASATDDPPPNRLPGDAYELGSNGTEIESRNHSVVAQWLSEWGNDVSNSLQVNLQFLRDRETPNSLFPRVEVDIASEFEDATLERQVRAGADFFAHASALDQDILQVTEALTWARGPHRLLVGGSFERFAIDRLFLPGSLGTYRFDSLEDFALNRPGRYDLNVPLDEDPAVRFAVTQWAGFVQDEWQVSDALNLRFGVRVDVPVIPDRPARNPGVAEDFGIDTSEMPSGNPLFSPRFGFNLRLGADRGTQIRGGAGLFTGRPPFAWLANAYQSTGLETAFLSCERTVTGDETVENAPPFDPTAPPPTTCRDGSGLETGRPVINAFDPDFRFPQDFKVSLSIDQRLPGGIVGTLEGVYTRAVNQFFIEDVNLGARTPSDVQTDSLGYTDGFGYGTRATFGDPTSEGFGGRRVSDRFSSVLRVTNSADNFAYVIGARLRKRFGSTLYVDAGYSFNRSGDTQTLLSLDATSNYGFNAIEGDPNDPQLQPSRFDRPHKVVVNVGANLFERFGGTEISLLYIGQSGAPYSYVYRGVDVNGDGYPGAGEAVDLTNDLIYVPEAAFDFPARGISGFLFETLIAREPCLQENRVRVLSRNACRAPWSNQLDLRITQNVRFGPGRAQIHFDVLNVLNLLNRDWGHVMRANPLVQVINVPGRFEDDPEFASPEPEPDDPLFGRYAGPLRVTEEGGFRAQLPIVPTIPASQWQAQLGVRISFR